MDSEMNKQSGLNNLSSLKFDPLYPETKGDWRVTLNFGKQWGHEGIGEFTFEKKNTSLQCFLSSLFYTVRVARHNTLTVQVFKRETLRVKGCENREVKSEAWVNAGFFAIPRVLRELGTNYYVGCNLIFNIANPYLREAEEGKMVIHV